MRALLSVQQAGHDLGVSTSTVWRMIRRGALPAVRMGGRRLVPRDSLSRVGRLERTARPRVLTSDHPFVKLIGAGRGGGKRPGAREKHEVLAIE